MRTIRTWKHQCNVHSANILFTCMCICTKLSFVMDSALIESFKIPCLSSSIKCRNDSLTKDLYARTTMKFILRFRSGNNTLACNNIYTN